MFVQTIKKILATWLVLSLVMVGFPWDSTLAYFNDTEKSEQNFITLGSLDFSLASETDFTPAVTPTQSSSRAINVVKDGSLDFQYKAVIDNLSGDNNLCTALTLVVSLDGNSVYNGPLTDFALTPTTDLGAYDFEATLTDSALSLQNQTCHFDFVFTAWQDNLSDENSGGFTDIETLSNTIESGSWQGVVLNEILPNPEGDDTQTGIQGEWVEIYNNGQQDVDLTDWYIEDNAGHRRTISSVTTYNGRTVIGTPGSYLEWLVVFMDGQVLNNSGDTVSLYDAHDNLIDSYTYSGSTTDDDSDSNNTPGGDNENGVGEETAGNEGKSYARIPDGVGDWVDPIPTPGAPNELTTDEDNTENNSEKNNSSDIEEETTTDSYFDITNQNQPDNTENNTTDNTQTLDENDNIDTTIIDTDDTYIDLTQSCDTDVCLHDDIADENLDSENNVKQDAEQNEEISDTEDGDTNEETDIVTTDNQTETTETEEENVTHEDEENIDVSTETNSTPEETEEESTTEDNVEEITTDEEEAIIETDTATTQEAKIEESNIDADEEVVVEDSE